MTSFDFTSIPQLRLSKGNHKSPQEGTCFYEAVAFFAGEDHTDRPQCVCPVLIEYGIHLNDDMPDDVRNDLLIPMIGHVAGTRDPDSEQKRAEFLAMWAVNKIVPIALRANGFANHAKACEDAQTFSEAYAAANTAAYAAYAAANAAAYAADAAADADDVWPIAVEGLRQAVLIGRHDGFTTDTATQIERYRREVVNA